MKIRMLVGIGGADFSLAPGDETEIFSENDAAALIASGQAEAAEAVDGGANPPAPSAKDKKSSGKKSKGDS